MIKDFNRESIKAKDELSLVEKESSTDNDHALMKIKKKEGFWSFGCTNKVSQERINL